MVNWYVKRNISSLSFDKAFKYLFNSSVRNEKTQSLAKIDKKSPVATFFKNAKNKLDDFIHGDDTYDYIMSNISNILESKDAQSEFARLIMYGGPMAREVLLDIMDKNSELIGKLLSKKTLGGFSQEFLIDEVMNMISIADSIKPRKFYKDVFMKLYKNIHSENFCIDLLALNGKEELLWECLNDGIIKSADIIGCVRLLENEPGKKEVLRQHAPELMAKTLQPIEVLGYMKKYGIDSKEVKNIMDSRLDDVIKEMCDGKIELFSMMIRELIEREDIRPSDITSLGGGAYSKAFGVGSKVVKIGENAEAYYIPKNSKRFLQPLIRHEEGKYRIEISEKVEVDNEISDDELYEVYRDLREEGLIWTDAKWDNVGRLLKDNLVYLENSVHVNPGEDKKEEVRISPYGPNLGFGDDNKVDVLKAGELVVIDLDFIYPESMKDDVRWPSVHSEYFESRYQKTLRSMDKAELYTIESWIAISKDITANKQIEAKKAIVEIEKERRYKDTIER